MEVVILVGLPASGKSSFYRERFAATHVHISKDNFSKHRRPARRQEREMREALEAGQSLIVDNTNASVEERAVPVVIAREFGARVVGYVFEFDVPACRERNAGREGAACIPVVGIYATAKRYQEPTLEEGFDELHRVRLVDAGFQVEEWKESESERV